jgi:hypothetical protein
MSQLDVLKARAEETQGVYSANATARLGMESANASVAKANAILNDARQRAQQGLVKTREVAVQEVISDASTAIQKAKEIVSAQATFELLRAAFANHSAHEMADSKRAVLIARIAELEAHVDAETARLDHHEAAFQHALRAAAELENGLEIKVSGGVSDKIREIIARVSGELTRVRAALLHHDEQTAAQRAALEN